MIKDDVRIRAEVETVLKRAEETMRPKTRLADGYCHATARV
jgi:hypothetical protein